LVSPEAGYAGTIGGGRKRKAICEALIKEGVNRTDSERVFSLVRPKIGAEKPEVGAVGSVAPLIQVSGKSR